MTNIKFFAVIAYVFCIAIGVVILLRTIGDALLQDPVPMWYKIPWLFAVVLFSILVGRELYKNPHYRFGLDPLSGMFIGMVSGMIVGYWVGAVWPVFCWTISTVYTGVIYIIPWIHRNADGE